MKKREKTKKESENKKTESRFQPCDSESMFAMMSECCEGRTRVPDCCAGMKKMWEEMQGKPQEKDRKQK